MQTLQLGMNILENSEDPDVKKSVYSLFASLSSVMKNEITPALPKIVESMLESIQNSDGIIVSWQYNFVIVINQLNIF